ncbi:MAG: UDP-glucose 4-epimerase GalE [Spirochaetaceae bacterium]|nr:UDP-glucose 4-epimerase GalE [Spirochaetaceae bacterium]
MRILIIGGAGYIGSHVAREFLDAGHEVVVYDNFSSGLRENVFAGEKLITGDILDYAALVRAMKTAQAAGGLDALVHLAAFKAAGESMIKPEKYSVNNITGTLNILNAACETGVKRIVFSSSAAVYGSPQYLPIDEAHPKDPENYYGFTKLEIERFLGWYDKLKGIRYAALRYFNAAGYDVKGRITGLEKNPANLIPVVMEAATGIRPFVPIFGNDYDTRDGSCIRDYIHVSDLATGHVAALNYIIQNDKSITVNLGSETGLTVLEIVEHAKRITGIDFKSVIEARRPGDPAVLTASSQYARETLGWSAKHSDVETLIKTSWNAYSGFS